MGAILRNAEVVLPVGFAGYPASVKTCSPVELQLETCPADSQIGTLEVIRRIEPNKPEPYSMLRYPLYNMTPPPNETAIFGFNFDHVIGGNIVLSVGPDYRVHARATNVIVDAEIVRQTLTVWGVPAENTPKRVEQRGQRCEGRSANPEHFVEECEGGKIPADENPVPYLVNPTQCTEQPLEAELKGVESWAGEAAPVEYASMGPFTGCESLRFAPTIAVAPEETQTTTPTGYAVDLRVPQAEGAYGVATADLKDAVVTMPAGVVLSPSAATGLEACTEAQIGLHTEQPVECPNASKLGVVSVITPALSGELKGALYLGEERPGPITKPPFTVYLTLEGHGVLVKIQGTVETNRATGQLTTTFDENPELPFSELKLQLTGGSRATLANPSTCGQFEAEAVLTPWSAPSSVTTWSPSFEITGCAAPRFDPSFAASMPSNQAAGYSPLRVTFSREDAEQDLGGIEITTPPGLSGNLTNIPLCGEPQATEGTCPEASQIGEVTVGAGPGPEPYFITGGRVFLTGPYNGAPFGLSIDVPEKAGPFDLGSGPCDCEVVRASVAVNPYTAQLTVTNGTLPSIKYGIPFQVKTVEVDINRPNFTFAPTACEPLSVSAKLTSTQGMSAQASSHLQVTNCAVLAFEPQFKVSTSGRTTREDGASLVTTLSYPKAPFGSQTNIAQVKVQLPKKLPSRLSTLQKACPAATFEANPAACPPASRVGFAKATTPIIPVPLTGPAYFVSHGGAAFPDLIIVLQGYGVTVDLVGSTFINEKTSITTSTFKTVPDVPVGTFQLTLPQGPYSALAAHGNLCKSQLAMPTEFVAQDGAIIRQSTPISVTGCPRHKAKHRAGHRSRHKGTKTKKRG